MQFSSAPSRHCVRHACFSTAAVVPSAQQWCPRVRSTLARKARVHMAHAGPSDVFVLDFDGVLVDSEPEVSTSAFAASRDYWPEAFAGVDESRKAAILDGLRRARPALVRGYEAMVMARLLQEDPDNWKAILRDWEPLLQQTMQRWGEDWQQLQEAFNAHRAEWMAADRQGWLNCNKPYPGITDALRTCKYPFYIASSKAGNRVTVLLQEQLGQDMPEDSPRLFAGLMPPDERKAAALREIAARPICAESGARLHFVDDRLATLQAIQRAPELKDWHLYLADWGYNTEEERAQARAAPGIRVLGLKDFLELLKWGVLMGVDDGCEPTQEEVAAGVHTHRHG